MGQFSYPPWGRPGQFQTAGLSGLGMKTPLPSVRELPPSPSCPVREATATWGPPGSCSFRRPGWLKPHKAASQSLLLPGAGILSEEVPGWDLCLVFCLLGTMAGGWGLG